MRGYTITRESGRKLSKLLRKERLQPPLERDTNTRPVGGVGGDNCILIYTPTGGVPGKSSTAPPFGFGAAICQVIDPTTEDFYDPPRFAMCKNVVDEDIAPNVTGKAERCGGVYIVDVASCGAE